VVADEGVKQDGMLGPYLLGPNETEEQGIYVGDCRENYPRRYRMSWWT